MRKKDVQTTLVFDISKTYQKEISKRPQFFLFQKYIKISTSKLHQFPIEIALRKHIEATLIFCPLRLCRKKYVVVARSRRFFNGCSKLAKKNYHFHKKISSVKVFSLLLTRKLLVSINKTIDKQRAAVCAIKLKTPVILLVFCCILYACLPKLFIPDYSNFHFGLYNINDMNIIAKETFLSGILNAHNQTKKVYHKVVQI